MKKHVRKNGIYKGVSKRKLVGQIKELSAEVSALEAYIQTACAGYQKDNERLFKVNKDLSTMVSQQQEENKWLIVENDALCVDIREQREHILKLEKENTNLKHQVLEQQLEINKFKGMPRWIQRMVRA